MQSHLTPSSTLRSAPASALPPAPSDSSAEIKVAQSSEINNIIVKKYLLAQHLNKIQFNADIHHSFDNNAAIQESISSLFNLAPGTLDQLMKDDLKAFGQIFGIEGHAIKATTFPQVLEMIVKGDNEQKEYQKVPLPDIHNEEVTRFGGWLREKFLLYFLCFMVECYSKLRAEAWGNLPAQISNHVDLEKVLLNEIWILVNAYKLYESYQHFSQPIDPKKGESKTQRKRAIEESRIVQNLLAAIMANDAADEFEYILPCGSTEHAVYVVLLHMKAKNCIYVRIDDSSSEEATTFQPYILDQSGKEKLALYLKKVLLQLSESNNTIAMDEIYQRDEDDVLLSQVKTDYPKMAKQTSPNCVVAGFMRGMRLRLNIKGTPRDALFSWLFREVKRFVADEHESKQEPQSVYAEQLELMHRAYALLPVSRLEQIKKELYQSYRNRAVMLEFAPHQSTSITVPISEKTFVNLALVSQDQQQQKEHEIRKELKQADGHGEDKGPFEQESPEKTGIKKPIKDKNEDFQCQQLLNSWEMLSQVQEPISIDELWLKHKSDQNIPQHLLIECSVGIGKTTLCGFIAAQWSQQKLWADQFDWVLWIPLRNLLDTIRYPQLANYNYSVKSFVLGECFGCFPNDRKQQLTIDEQDELWQQLEERSYKVLYVLDGYDEIAGYEKRPELAHLKAALSQLFQNKHILLTTRPQVINAQLLKEQQTRRLVTLGLQDENIPLYIENYFEAISSHSGKKPFSLVEEKNPQVVPLKSLQADQSTETVSPYIEDDLNTTRSNDPEEKTINVIEDKFPKIKYLLEGLKANQTLWSFSHVPLHLSFICLAYAEGMIKAVDLKQSLSLTQLYQKIVNLLLHRYFLKENSKGTTDIEAKRVEVEDDELEPNTQRVAQFLEVFAFQGMGQSDLILDKKLLNESLKATNQTFAIIPSLIASRLLKEVNDQGKAAYQFVHLTFQEFFAARFLARRLQQPQTSINDWIERFHEYKHIPRFAVMLWFTAGLLKDEPLHLQQYIQLLQAPPRDEVGLYHLGLVMRCVAEAGYPKELTAQISQHLGQLVEKSWFVIREAIFSKDGNKEIRAQSAQQVLQWLGQQRELTPKIEFSAVSLKAIVKDLSYQSLVIKIDDWRVRKAAAEILGILKAPTPEILLALVALLKDEYWRVRHAAARALGELKAPTPEIFLALVALLKDEKWQAREGAARAVKELKASTPKILLALVALLKDNDKNDIFGNVRQAAALALVELKAPTSEILQGLVALLKDWNDDVRQAATRALVELKAPTPEILLALVALLKDNESYAREAAARTLGELKGPTPEILLALVALLKDNYSNVRRAAARALGELKAPTPEILQGLVALLKDNDWDSVRGAAARALGELKAPNPEILLALVALLKDNESDIRQAAARALGELKAPTPEILQSLMALLKDEKWQAREGAARALGELKAPTPEILQGLVALLKDLNDDVRQAAARALGELKAPTPEILQGLVALLKDWNNDVRQAATRALGELKAPTPEILFALVDLLKDNVRDVRRASAEALNNFSTAFLLTIYFQQSCQLYQSSIQEWLLNFIGQRWLVNRQVVKLVNQEIYSLEQGQWQHLYIPYHHPHFQSCLAKAVKELVGSPLCLNLPKFSNAKNVTHFTSRSSSSPQAALPVEHIDSSPK